MGWNTAGWLAMALAGLTGAGTGLVLVPSSAGEAAPAAAGRTPPELLMSGVREAEALTAKGKLAIGCAAKTGEWTTTFLRQRKGPAVIAAFADRPLRDVGKDWSRSRAMRDWAHVHDRNGDGRIDHIVFNIGPLPLAPPGKAALPVIADGTIAGDAVMVVLENMRTAYWQAIDSNGDGKLDWLGVPAMRKDNGWYSGWALLSLRESATQCTLVDSDGRTGGTCTEAADGTIAGETATARRWVRQPQIVFDAILQGAAACRLSATDLRR